MMNKHELPTREEKKPDRHFPLKQQKPLVQILHNRIKGRVRYKVRGLQQSENLQQYLKFRLSREPGIDFVRANSWTGNVLILFTKERHQNELASLIATIVQEYRQQPKDASEPRPNWLETVPKPSQLLPLESWHLQETEAILTDLETSRQSGLSLAKVQDNLQQYGANVIVESPPRSGLSIFIDYFKSIPVALLTLAAVLSIVTGGIIDAGVIMGVVVINAILGYATESQSEKIIHSLKNLVNPSAWAIRASNLTKINSQEIVIGDILVLKPGSYVAADARLIEADRLSVDESALTGESVPVLKTTQTLTGQDIPLAERANMVYRGTLVTGGQGMAVVVATGQLTEMGRKHYSITLQVDLLLGQVAVPWGFGGR